MIITVNGEKQTVEMRELVLSELLVMNKVDKPDMVSVQVNGQFVDKMEYGLRRIAENDEVDFLYFVGGGRSS